MAGDEAGQAAASAAPTVTLAQAVKAASALKDVLDDPALKLLHPAAVALAASTERQKELDAQVTVLDKQVTGLRTAKAQLLADATDYKQAAIDDIQHREAAHREACAKLTVQAQEDVAVLDAEKQRIVAETKQATQDHVDALAAMKAEMSVTQSELDQLTAKLAAAKAKLAELLAPPPAESTTATTSTSGGN